MAVTPTPAGLRTELDAFHSRWPTSGIDLDRAWVDYDLGADEMLVNSGGEPVSAVNVPIDARGQDDIDLLVDEESETVVGLQVDGLRAGIGRAHPRWAPLADDAALPRQRREALAAVIADAAGLFALHGAVA